MTSESGRKRGLQPALASLPMYDWPQVRAATDRLWTAIGTRLRQAGLAAPDNLCRTADVEAAWRDPRLLLSQTCGYPLVTRLAGRVHYLATPHYDAPGCDGPNYCSIIISLKGAGKGLADFSGKRIGINADDSLSGCVALKAAIAEAGFRPESFGDWERTGSHRISLEAVASGDIDLAAIDAVAFAIATDHLPHLIEKVQIIGKTPPLPGLPLITGIAAGDKAAAIRETLSAVVADPGLSSVRTALHLSGLSVLPAGAYHTVLQTARRAGI